MKVTPYPPGQDVLSHLGALPPTQNHNDIPEEYKAFYQNINLSEEHFPVTQLNLRIKTHGDIGVFKIGKLYYDIDNDVHNPHVHLKLVICGIDAGEWHLDKTHTSIHLEIHPLLATKLSGDINVNWDQKYVHADFKACYCGFDFKWHCSRYNGNIVTW